VGTSSPERSRISKERHKSKIHVQLLMAMKQGQSGVIRDEIKFCLLKTGAGE
jgi:hypothetical protein